MVDAQAKHAVVAVYFDAEAALRTRHSKSVRHYRLRRISLDKRHVRASSACAGLKIANRQLNQQSHAMHRPTRASSGLTRSCHAVQETRALTQALGLQAVMGLG